MSDHIPPEVLTDILAKLSPAAIIRCTTVCKSWYSLITSPVFASLHAQRTAIKKSSDLFLVRNYEHKADSFSLNFDDDSLSEYERLDFSFNPDHKVVDCLNGVVCLSDDVNIVFWNPTIRKFLQLPQPIVPFNSKKHDPPPAIGFGYDASTNDFKVIRVLDYDRPEVYELNIGCWRTIEPKGDFGEIFRFTNQAFLNGTVHWVGNRCEDDGIVSFDFRNETFGTIDMPDYLTDRHLGWNLRVSMMGDSLSLIYHKLVGRRETCFIWVMKEYGVADSWTKLYNVITTHGIHPSEIFCIRKNGEPLLTDKNGKALYSYVPDRKIVKRLKLFNSEKFEVVSFTTESLALLGVKGTKQMLKTAVTQDKAAIKGSFSYVHLRKKKMKIK